MSTLNKKLMNKSLIQKTFSIGLIVLFLLVSQATLANSLNSASTTANNNNHSIGGFKQALDNSVLSIPELLEKTEPSTRTLKHQGMQRKQVNLSRKQQAAKKSNKAPALLGRAQNQATSSTDVYYSFSIYTAYSQLLTDIDQDGYYQTFSVNFDADILSSQPEDQTMVYADLYLSKNGEPWVLYFTTDDFLITGENTEDEFEVITRLESGYTPDNYDVLIDLYEVGYSDVVATFSSDDTNALYALPLESTDYDPEYVEVVEIVEVHEVHSGSASTVFCSFLLLIIAIRCYLLAQRTK